MTQSTSTHAVRFTAFAVASGLLLSACGGRGPKPPLTVDQDLSQLGTQNQKPGTTDEFYIIDAHGSGQKQGLRMVEMYWGRLVNVTDASGDVIYRDFVIDPGLVGDSNGEGTLAISSSLGSTTVDYEYSQNPVTGQETFNVKSTNDPLDGEDNFDLALQVAASGVNQISFSGVSDIGSLSRIPRNGAIVVHFDDMLDEESIILNDTVKILTGSPPTEAFDARLLADPNHGGIDPASGEFVSTRLIIDTTISAFELGGDVGSLPLNSLGLPTADSQSAANVAILFPTTVASSTGQFRRLTNLNGKPLFNVGNGPVASSPSNDVVRAMRTGTVADPDNGFLFDATRPRLLASQGVVVTAAVPPAGVGVGDAEYGYVWDIDYAFLTPTCGVLPVAGEDVIQFSNTLYANVIGTTNIVTDPPSPLPGGGVNSVSTLRVEIPRLASFLPEASSTFDPTDPQDVFDFLENDVIGTSVMQFPWRPASMTGQSSCFAAFSPGAGVAPASEVPNNAQITLRFSEPMDPASFGAFSSFQVTRVPASATPFNAYDYVIGSVSFAPDLREFRFQPLLPFSNQPQGSLGTVDAGVDANLTYHLGVTSSVDGGLRDLFGNPLGDVIENVEFDVIDDSVATVANGGYVFRFEDDMLDETGNGRSDIDGQFNQDQLNGTLLPRPVSNFSRTIDVNQPIVALMNLPAVAGVQTPLSNLGSRLHALWRYADLGLTMSAKDREFTNIDIEFTYLSPVGGQIVSAFYPEFFMGIAHGCCVPDEFQDQLTGFPEEPLSGYKNNSSFAETYLTIPGATPQEVHPRESGFTVASSELFTAETGTPLLRMPMNRGISEGERTTFTWRDAAITERGALAPTGQTKGAGVPLKQEVANLNLPQCWGSIYGGGTDRGVPTTGLPILMEYRTYPTETLALINFGISISSGSSRNPFHRAFSTGGYNTQDAAVVKNPDTQTSPTGGFNGNPLAGAPLGSTTPGLDNTVYYGQVDFVVRLSRAHTVPIDANGISDPNYRAVTLEPSAANQPLGTSVELAYRGHDTPIPLTGDPGRILDASNLDAYGDEVPPGDGFTTGANCGSTNYSIFTFDSPNWSSDLNDVDGSRYVQVRFTFVNNLSSRLAPVLDSFGVAYQF
ncbi:hypothetical protein Pla163_28640 [Planctomycetes bacterium Pla163]|uniref:SbsA Ig-like domain-containing protein n=1 Tax=Rohdeia mirabilis TaxID=2528008 RepID=A0A518D2N0_9BACT|nr:hypothetical protein Pla163_28640 [Planctomycetes bacterium Pla163]